MRAVRLGPHRLHVPYPEVDAGGEADARARIIERAAIEFDPAVVNVLLSLRDLEELRSFAKPLDPLAGTTATTDDGWSLFSLFMK